MDLNKLLLKCDLVFTAEGSIDFQTPRGKIPAEVAKCAKRYGLPVIALVGTVGKGHVLITITELMHIQAYYQCHLH